MAVSADDRLRARNDLAWAISVGGIGVVGFAALLLFTWHFAATLFLIFAGMLLGVALNAMTNLLGRVVRLPHSLRLTLVCLALAGMLSGVVFLGGATIAQTGHRAEQYDQIATGQRQGLPRQERHRYQLSRLSNLGAPAASSTRKPRHTPARRRADPHNLPSAGAIASSGGAIVSQTLKVLLGTVSAVGNFFIVLFLGLAFAAQPARLSKRTVVHGAGAASRPRHRDRRPHR